MARLDGIARQVQREFGEERRVLSFHEYLELVAADPPRQCRDAARYLRDAFDHFGRSTLKRPWGEITRYRLFDLPWLDAVAAEFDLLIDPTGEFEVPVRAMTGHVSGAVETVARFPPFGRSGPDRT